MEHSYLQTKAFHLLTLCPEQKEIAKINEELCEFKKEATP
jgi:hypothetical protein